MKRTCERCRALHVDLTHFGWRVWCDLNYPTDPNEQRNEVTKSLIPWPRPLAPCPKPLSDRKWLEAEPYTKPKETP